MDYPAGDIHRTSLNGQGDTDGTVLTDTFASRKKRKPVAFQTRVCLMRPAGTTTSSRLDSVTTMSSAAYPDKHKSISQFTLGEHLELAVPPYAQNIHSGEFPEFGGGREVWCSPTSSAMVMGYFGAFPERRRAGRHPVRRPAGRPRRPPRLGLRLRRSGQLAVQRLRPHLRAGRLRHPPAVGGRSGALCGRGHPGRGVAVVEAGRHARGGVRDQRSPPGDRGLTADGDPILNDPAANSNDDVRSIYTRENFETVWQESTGGVSYVYHPSSLPLPANVPGATPNW